MKVSFNRLSWRSHALALTLAASLVPAVGAAENNSCRAPNAYVQRNLVADRPGFAEHVDPNLVNPFGIAFNLVGNVWVSDNRTGVSTLYDGDGVPEDLIVTIPSAPGSTATGSPTGIVFNFTGGFPVTGGGASAPSRFIFSTEDGTISGWSPAVDRTHAFVVVDNSSKGAVYKGLAIAANGTDFFVYATDFRNGRIDVYDSSFAPATLAGSFSDPTIPAGFAPFGIQYLNGNIYVTYARQNEDRDDEVVGKGLGYVSVFDTNGRFVRRIASRSKLNAPWGLALAPASFGKFGGKLLVGNFGDGIINVYDPQNGHCEGRLERPDGKPLKIDGLWGLSFGNGTLNQPVETLFFTAGPEDETHGLYGRLDAMPVNCIPSLAPEPESN
jgi:uncharacterized protein (TIGR03118 family)